MDTEIVGLELKEIANSSPVKRLLTMTIKGHPTGAINKAHNLASIILSNKRWRFTYIAYNTPNVVKDLASDGTMYLEATQLPD